MMSATRGGAAGAEEDKLVEDEEDDDEVYQYPKAGLGPTLGSIESILRCAICRGLSDPPVSLPCCQQTFCSLCIRQYLNSTTPRCPCCRKPSASNMLQLSKELRSICTTWKDNRRAILAAANASATAPASGAAPAPAREQPAPSARRKGCAVGAGQGRDGDGGVVKAVHYHSLNDSKMKALLIRIGLPVGGGKAAMVARHKRLVLLSAASNDREVPLPKAELLRQVAAWERKKDKERLTNAKTARAGLVPGSTGSGGGSRQALLPAGTGGAATAATGDGSPSPEAEKFVISKEMKDGFSALIASARSKAKKRPSTSTCSDGGGNSENKKARVCQDSDCGGCGSRNVDGAGSVGDGGNVIRKDAGGCSSLNSRSADVGGGASRNDAPGDAAEILGVAGRLVRTRGPWRCIFSQGRQPLASVGKVRSEGTAAAAAAAAATAAGVMRRTEGCKSVRERALSSAGGDGFERNGGRTSNGVGKSNGGGVDAAATVGGDGRSGSEGTQELSVVAAAAAAAAAADGRSGFGGGGEGGDRRGGQEEGARPVREPRAEQGPVYLNTATMETVREPPAELVALADQAESAGDYLVFVPSHGFVAAAAGAVPASASSHNSNVAAAPALSHSNSNTDVDSNGSNPAAASAFSHNSSNMDADSNAAVAVARMSEAAPAVGAAAERVLQVVAAAGESCSPPSSTTAVNAGTGSGGAAAAAAAALGSNTRCNSQGDQVQGTQQGSPLEASMTPSTVAKAVLDVSSSSSSSGRRGGSGGGGGTWDRLSSLPTIDLSQGVASAPLDVENVGGARGNAAVTIAATWTCVACTLTNKARRTTCELCGTSRPKASSQQRHPSSSSSSVDSGGGGGGGGGSHRRVGSVSKLRLRQPARSTSITPFTSRPGGGGSATGVGGSTGAPASSSSPQPPLSQAAATTPINGFPSVRSQERSSPPSAAAAVAAAAAAAAADKARQ
ncbi:unnamed protein product [Ectocarpus sp. 12 AP-2014]